MLVLAHSTLIAHFWRYYFLPVGEPWWKGAVWGNVIADVPNWIVLGAGGAALYLLHKRMIAPLHEKVDAHVALAAAHHAEVAELHAEGKREREAHLRLLESVFDVIDPTTDGGLTEIRDRLDETTPGGIGALRERLDELAPPKHLS